MKAWNTVVLQSWLLCQLSSLLAHCMNWRAEVNDFKSWTFKNSHFSIAKTHRKGFMRMHSQAEYGTRPVLYGINCNIIELNFRWQKFNSLNFLFLHFLSFTLFIEIFFICKIFQENVKWVKKKKRHEIFQSIVV